MSHQLDVLFALALSIPASWLCSEVFDNPLRDGIRPDLTWFFGSDAGFTVVAVVFLSSVESCHHLLSHPSARLLALSSSAEFIRREWQWARRDPLKQQRVVNDEMCPGRNWLFWGVVVQKVKGSNPSWSRAFLCGAYSGGFPPVARFLFPQLGWVISPVSGLDPGTG